MERAKRRQIWMMIFTSYSDSHRPTGGSTRLLADGVFTDWAFDGFYFVVGGHLVGFVAVKLFRLMVDLAPLFWI